MALVATSKEELNRADGILFRTLDWAGMVTVRVCLDVWSLWGGKTSCSRIPTVQESSEHAPATQSPRCSLAASESGSYSDRPCWRLDPPLPS